MESYFCLFGLPLEKKSPICGQCMLVTEIIKKCQHVTLKKFISLKMILKCTEEA